MDLAAKTPSDKKRGLTEGDRPSMTHKGRGVKEQKGEGAGEANMSAHVLQTHGILQLREPLSIPLQGPPSNGEEGCDTGSSLWPLGGAEGMPLCKHTSWKQLGPTALSMQHRHVSVLTGR